MTKFIVKPFRGRITEFKVKGLAVAHARRNGRDVRTTLTQVHRGKPVEVSTYLPDGSVSNKIIR